MVVYWMGWRKVKGGGLVFWRVGVLAILFESRLLFGCTFDATLVTVLC